MISNYPPLSCELLSRQMVPCTLGGCLLIIIHNTTFTCTLQKLKSKNQSRWLYILRNGKSFQGIFSPDYLNTTTIYNSRALSGQFDFVIYGDEEPLQSPILNALEVYTVKEFLQSETNQQDGKELFVTSLSMLFSCI